MDHLRTVLRSGAWLTAERIRITSLILVVLTLAALGGWTLLSEGGLDRNGKPVGTDFSSVYAAGTEVLAGHAADPYEPPLHSAAQRATFGGRDVPWYGWHYPPAVLFLAALLALLPYGASLAVWLSTTALAYVATLRAIVPGVIATRDLLLVALAFPAVFVNLGHGQNGFLTAALLGGGLLALPGRPLIAGLLFGLLAYKPQFGILLPLVLLVQLRWRAILAAVLTVSAASAASLALLGPSVWRAFLASTAFTRDVVLEQGNTGWAKIQSLFAFARMWGAGVPLAYALQFALLAALAASLGWMWRSRAPYALKASALATATLLATPYVLDYDFVVLAVSIAFLVRHGLRHGFAPWERSAMALAFIAPLVARSIGDLTGVPLGLIAMLALYAVTLHRALVPQAATRPARAALVTA